MTTYELISTCNIEWDLCRIVCKATGEILKDYFNRKDFFNDNNREVEGWEMYIYKPDGKIGYITIIIEV